MGNNLDETFFKMAVNNRENFERERLGRKRELTNQKKISEEKRKKVMGKVLQAIVVLSILGLTISSTIKFNNSSKEIDPRTGFTIEQSEDDFRSRGR